MTAPRPGPDLFGRRPTPPPLTQPLLTQPALQQPHRPLDPDPTDTPPTAAAERDATCHIHYWNHTCPTRGCGRWVPNHHHTCAQHTEQATS